MFFRRPAAQRTSPLVRRTLSLEPLESRQMLAGDFHLLSDVNQTLEATGADIGEIVVIGETAYFTANDGVSGRELWKSDGTPHGTVRVKDIFPGDKGSNPTYLTEFQGVLYFAASDHEVSSFFSGERDVELWRSDGTDAGTYRVKDLVAGDQASSPRQLMNVGGTLFFSALEWYGGSPYLWKTDGTESGTARVVIPGGAMEGVIQPDFPQFIGSVGELLLFTSYADLWRSDGTGSGTFKLKDLNYGAPGESPRLLTSTGATAYFAANDGASGFRVWKTDGTVEGTVPVSSVKPKTSYYAVVSAASLGEMIVFAASDALHGEELWISDGTPEGTVLLKDIRPGSYTSPWGSGPNSSAPFGFTNVNGTVYFATSSPAGADLWKTDGTTDGTVLVKVAIGYGSQQEAQLSNVGGKLYFSGSIGEPSELWTSDGTEAGTVRIKDIAEGIGGSYPRLLTEFNGGAIFMATDYAHGAELWKTDGTEAGTSLIKDILPATADSNPSLATNVNGAIFFKADDGVAGEELWVYDGGENARRVKDIRPGLAGSTIQHLTNANGTLFFTANDGVSTHGLWKSDGTAAGTVLLKSFAYFSEPWQTNPFAAVGGVVYFSADDGVGGMELWKSDGTELGTVQVKDVFAGSGGCTPANLLALEGFVYFTANDAVTGMELWKSDGTDAGTVLVRDVQLGSTSSSPALFTEVNGVLYFRANDGVTGEELWRSDGTEAGTYLLNNIATGMEDSRPRQLINVEGTLYFVADHYVAGTELWKSDGTEAGTISLTYLSGAQHITNVANVDSTVYFSVVGEGDWTLWKTDGSSLGTTIIRPFIRRDDGYGVFKSWNGELYFTTNNQGHGAELWRSDGTAQGTELAQQFANPDEGGVQDNALYIVNDRLLLVAKTIRYGVELWISESATPALAGDYDANGVVDGADFLAWQRGFGGVATPAGSGADGDGSGAVDAGDLGVWAEHFGEGSSAGVVAVDAALSAAMSAAVVEAGEGEEFAPVSLAGAEGVVAVDEFVAKPRAAGSRSLIALAQGAFGIEESRARSAAAEAVVRADDGEEIPHARAKRASSRDAVLTALADWPRATRRSWSLSRERLMEFDGDEESPLEFNWQLAQDSGWIRS